MRNLKMSHPALHSAKTYVVFGSCLHRRGMDNASRYFS